MTMRVALIPLDNRPANRQFPARLADIAGIELFTPARDLLGNLQCGADGIALAAWLRDTVYEYECDAAVFSWDALIYGGLIQSRQLEHVTMISEIAGILGAIDWRRTAGYAYLTVPRLGISVTARDKLPTHADVREYLAAKASQDAAPANPERIREIETRLGHRNIEQIWRWRERNHTHAFNALKAAAQLGLKLCHIAVEDNAPTGPHLQEVEALRQLYFGLRRDHPDFRCTFFDGADECACLLLAKALADTQPDTPLPVQLSIHPSTPGPDRYTGRFESHTLEDGIGFLGRFLGLHYHYADRPRQWLIVHGVQPQPDLFEDNPDQVFNNPFLLPKGLPGTGNLYVSDLAACNGTNPRLVAKLAGIYNGRLQGLVGFNTNFNTLGVTAALLRLAPAEPTPATQRFLVERLADDLVFQSIARPQLVSYLIEQDLDPMDFSAAHPLKLRECELLVQRCWKDWIGGQGREVLSMTGVGPNLAAQVRFRFPWYRAFEVEASLDF